MSILPKNILEILDIQCRRNPSDIKQIIIHCSATDRPTTALDVHSWHLDQGWLANGYNAFIRSDGTVELCRPYRNIGSHCYRQNRDSIGICVNGLDNFNKKQFRSLNKLLKSLCKEFDIPRTEIYPHNHYTNKKTCPNFDVYKYTIAKRKT